MVDSLKSDRLKDIGEYYFSHKLREIEGLNNSGRNILNLGIGNPDFEPPKEVMSALAEALLEPRFNGYQSYKGLPELRVAISTWYKRHFSTTLNPDSEVLPLMGSKEGVMHISMAFLNKGDGALVPNPGYPTYSSVTKLAGGRPIAYQLSEANDYLPEIAELEALDLTQVKLMWINYPHMPTGKECSRSVFNDLIAFCKKHEIILINDNPYGFTLTNEPLSLLEDRSETDLVLELNSLSKSHNMAGWRVGMLCGNADLINTVLTFKSNMDSGMFKPIMRASIEALKQPQNWYDDLNVTYKKRQAKVFEIADLLECTYDRNQVGMFVWTKIPEQEKDGKMYADKLIDLYDIFVPPGMVFGDEGNQHIRFSLCSSEEVWNEVLQRIRKNRR
ncbi:MAG: pyridoxal phosphate-dependent aminotransferase [Ekhidna sp.]